MKRKTIMGILLSLSIFAGSLPSAPVSAKTVIYPTEATGEKVEDNNKEFIADLQGGQGSGKEREQDIYLYIAQAER